MGIFDLPQEILEEVMLFSDPVEVAALAQTCRLLYHIVYPGTVACQGGAGGNEDEEGAVAKSTGSSSILWRDLYLQQPLDDPRTCVTSLGVPRTRAGIDWQGELQGFIRVRNVLRRPGLCGKGKMKEVLRTFVFLVMNVPSMKVIRIRESGREFREVEPSSSNLAWVAGRLRASPILEEIQADANGTVAGGDSGATNGAIWLGAETDGVAPIEDDEETQLRAQLHTYYGITQRDLVNTTRVNSRAFVYDLRHYTWANEFGPFDNDGNVNWVHVKQLHHLVSMHVVDLDFLTLGGMFLTYPLSLPFSQPDILEDVDLDETGDWAGVTGIWQVSFCFCNHRDLLEYNSSAPKGQPLDKSIFERPDFAEVFRTLLVEIRVTHTSPQGKHPSRPVIYFAGAMAEPSTSTMVGNVHLTPDGHVQWHFVSGEEGNAIWSSEGVQIGGIRSQYGVLGAWTTVFHDRDDPVGPFWLRKVGELPPPRSNATSN